MSRCPSASKRGMSLTLIAAGLLSPLRNEAHAQPYCIGWWRSSQPMVRGLVQMAGPKIKRFGSNIHWSPSEKKFIIIDMQ